MVVYDEPTNNTITELEDKETTQLENWSIEDWII